eukprot:5709073-Pleurochrysis_carterae.AAC.5
MPRSAPCLLPARPQASANVAGAKALSMRLTCSCSGMSRVVDTCGETDERTGGNRQVWDLNRERSRAARHISQRARSQCAATPSATWRSCDADLGRERVNMRSQAFLHRLS